MADGDRGGELDAVRLPHRRIGPVNQVLRRLAVALGVLALAWVVVYLGRAGYHDNSTDGPPDAVGALYYVTVSLSTTGYGDIVPVSAAARLVNILVITPLRVVFLVILVGTTVEVLVGRTHDLWRRNRWRAHMNGGHTVVIGYGTKGRAAVATLLAGGVTADRIVVVDGRAAAVAEATSAGLTGVQGDGSRIAVLRQAFVESAGAVVVATGQDDAGVLVTLSVRRLNAKAVVATSVRESEHVELARQSGANSVVASSDAAGRLLGAATISPSVSDVLLDLLRFGQGLEVGERAVRPDEVGLAPAACADVILAVIRDGKMLRFNEVSTLAAGDRLVVVTGT